MSCYFRHLKDIFDEAGIKVDSGNRKQVDQAVHQIAGIDYKDCPQTWQKVKQQITAGKQSRQDFVVKLRGIVFSL